MSVDLPAQGRELYRYPIDVPATPSLSNANLRFQDALGWRKWPPVPLSQVEKRRRRRSGKFLIGKLERLGRGGAAVTYGAVGTIVGP